MGNLDSVELTKIFHSCFIIKYADGTTILTDPYFGKDLPKGFKLKENPITTYKDLPKIDLITVTHEHFDHFDKEAIEYIVNRDGAIVIASHNIMSELDISKQNQRIVKVDDKVMVAKVKIIVLPSQHPQSFYPLGFLFEYMNKTIYFAGDTFKLPSQKIEPNICILPCGGTFTADLFVFVSIARKLRPKYVIPMHYNTFQMIEIDCDKLKDRCAEKLKNTDLILLENGESRNLI